MGTLLPPWFVKESVSNDDLKITTLVFGITIGICTLTVWKAGHQTVLIWKRTHRVSVSYFWMIWLELLANILMSMIVWMYMDGIIAPSFALFFVILTLWVIQLQMLIQIIINRLSLIMLNERLHFKLKWGYAIFITAINISVYCVWIPARMQISPGWIHTNAIWDRIEKILYLLSDAGLNGYFVYLVHTRLISQGLQKYKPLLQFNIAMIVVSISMDALLIGMMDLPNTFAYVQFHPLAFCVKLFIEMSMAELIAKIVRRSLHGNDDSTPHALDPGSAPRSHPRSQNRSNRITREQHELKGPMYSTTTQTKCIHCGLRESDFKEDGTELDHKRSSSSLSDGLDGGITKTVQTEITTKWIDDHGSERDILENKPQYLV